MQDIPPPANVGAPATRIQNRIRFTGSGSEFFRIWVVNLLLTLVTLTLYWPFARARRLTYFHNHTEVHGDALGFHGDPWKMFKGHLVLLVVGGTYAGLLYLWPSYEWIGLVLMALAWPALWRASLGFRLRNTSWRGVRFDFEGSLAQSYKVLLPFFLPAIGLSMMPFFMKFDPEAVKWVGWVSLTISGLFFLFFPWLLARMYRYQHGGFRFAQERSVLNLETPSLYWLFFSFFLLFFALILVLMGLGFWLVRHLAWSPAVAIPVLVGVGYFVSFIVIYSLAAVKIQNRLWSNTASTHIRMNSDLSFWRYLGLTTMNWVLIVLTLGFYWPFAAVRAARMRLQAVTVQIDGDVGSWVSQVTPGSRGVLGDASGDYFGLDLGI